ncbi:MAG: TolC family protein, partial [Proteobacteria bacterium]|nr:TolC family protein [Pseudomonadota bacterium]
RFSVMMVFLLVMGTGCIHPDHWPVFQSPSSPSDLEDNFFSLSQKETVEILKDKAQPVAVVTGNSLAVSLDQALVMALETNSGIRVVKYNPVLAGLNETIERGKFDPQVFSEFTTSSERTRELDSGTWKTAGEQNHTAGIGMSEKFPSGTDIEVGLSHRIDDTHDESQEQTSRIGMTITQALLQGYDPFVNLASIRQAELDTKVSFQELRGITEALLADTETAYWDHVLARQEIDIFKTAMDVAKKQLSEVVQRIEIGTLPPVEAAAARVEVALRDQDLINAKSAFEESRLRLLFYIHQGRDEQYHLEIQATTRAQSETEPLGMPSDHIELADRFRSDLQEARLRIKQNRLEIVKTRNGILPRLDLFITLGKSGYADSFSSSFRAMGDSFYDLSAGIKFSRPLGNRSAYATDRAARVTLIQTREALENLRQIIERDVRIALNNLDRVNQQIAATRVTRMHQEESLKAEQERFEAGTSTSLMVAQAQRDLLTSHIREKEAVIDYKKALVKLFLAEGSLLERRGIRLSEF